MVARGWNERISAGIGLATVAFAALAATAVPGQCTGTPSLTPPIPYFTGQSAPVFSVEHADLDGDGDQDLVSSNGPRLVVMRNAGAAAFVVELPVPAASPLYDLSAGDFNSDGLMDVAASGTAVLNAGTAIQGRLVIFLNQTAPGAAAVTFAPPVEFAYGPIMVAGSTGKALATADLNADGILDAAIVDTNAPHGWVLLGNGAFGQGDGTFGPATPYPVGALMHMDVAVGDFDQDGAPDLAFVRYGGSLHPTTVALLAGQLGGNGLPTGTFVPVSTVAIPGPPAARAIAAGDVNADGFLDLVVANSMHVGVAYGSGGFAFTATAYPAGPVPIDLTLGDFTGDGLTDVAVARDSTIGGGPGNFSILAGQIGGGLVGYNALAFNEGLPQCITAADFDGDGRLDVAAGRATGGVDVRLGACPASAPPLAVTVVHPNGGEILAAGAPAPVIWTKSATVALVDVDVSRNGGATWETIATSLSGTSLTWLVTPPGASQALVRVRASGIDSVSDTSDVPFAVAAPGAASSAFAGPGCAPGALAPPMLAIGPPVLGGSTNVSVQEGAGGAHAGAIFLSPVPPASTAIGPGCLAHLDLAALILGVELTSDPSGNWSVVVTLPPSFGMVGVAVRAQAVVALALAPGYALTNGLELTFGF